MECGVTVRCHWWCMCGGLRCAAASPPVLLFSAPPEQPPGLVVQEKQQSNIALANKKQEHTRHQLVHRRNHRLKTSRPRFERPSHHLVEIWHIHRRSAAAALPPLSHTLAPCVGPLLSARPLPLLPPAPSAAPPQLELPGTPFYRTPCHKLRGLCPKVLCEHCHLRSELPQHSIAIAGHQHSITIPTHQHCIGITRQQHSIGIARQKHSVVSSRNNVPPTSAAGCLTNAHMHRTYA